jgi:hypothetical protein
LAGCKLKNVAHITYCVTHFAAQQAITRPSQATRLFFRVAIVQTLRKAMYRAAAGHNGQAAAAAPFNEAEPHEPSALGQNYLPRRIGP